MMPTAPPVTPYVGPAFLTPAGYESSRAASHRPAYEHRDHEGLPVGTRIYFVNGFRMIVRPGQRGPQGVTPDIIVVR